MIRLRVVAPGHEVELHKTAHEAGLVPLYLVAGNDYAQPEHVGSTDVDVALRLVVEADDEGAYSTLEKNLKRAGFGRVDVSSWRWSADVDGHPVVLELLGDAAATAPGTVFSPKVMTTPAAPDSERLTLTSGLHNNIISVSVHRWW